MSDSLYYIWKKGQNIRLTKNFNSIELQCKCKNTDCIEQRISKELLDKIQLLRDIIGPLIINSGFRCLKHNTTSGGHPNSTHTRGDAVDVSCKDLNLLYLECEKRFSSVGDGRNKGFVHVDIRNDKLRRWNY